MSAPKAGPRPLSPDQLAPLVATLDALERLLPLCAAGTPLARSRPEDAREITRSGKRLRARLALLAPARPRGEDVPRCHCGEPPVRRVSPDGGATWLYRCARHATEAPHA